MITIILTLLITGGQDAEKKRVVCTLPVLKSIADELGGDRFDVTALSKPDQDPHFVSPTPSLMKRLREADLFIEIGLQLELWADEVADGSGNPRVQKGGAGRIVASAGISREDVPKIVDRSQGDVHPEGNPHVWLDPLRAQGVAENIAAGLKRASPHASGEIDARLKRFKERIDEALFGPELIKEVGVRTLHRKTGDGTLFAWLEEKKLKAGGWLKKARPLWGLEVVEHHRAWGYLAGALGFKVIASIEQKPGIQPGPRSLRELEETIKSRKVRVIIVDEYQDPSYARALGERTGAKVAIVSNQPGAGDYVKFIDSVIDHLVEAAK
jgi:zinc/manganese transport system substrate-binding protein